MRTNPLMNTDSYKHSHYLQYPPGTEYVSSYIESRGGMFDKTVMFGLQYIRDEYLTKPFNQAHIDRAEKKAAAHGIPFNKEGFQYILDTYKGFWPVKITAVPEGTVVDGKNVLVQIVNTDPKCFWVTSFIETMILRVWYTINVASLSWHIKQDILKALEKTADKPMDVIGFMLNDFGSRGTGCLEQSVVGGMAHLTSFQGTDNLPAIDNMDDYYDEFMAGFSIAAAEHATITSWEKENESKAYANMIDKFASKGILAVVSDSYDIYNACKNIWGNELKEKVKTCGARVVIRPDSGDPETVPVECVKILMNAFYEDVTVNDKGYRVLPSYLRVIQGDGVNRESINKIMLNLILEGYSVENVCFGMGGALLQKHDRDSLKFAQKCSAVCVNGIWRDVFKDPITDKGKQSKKGILGLYKDSNNKYVTDRVENAYMYKTGNLLKTVYANGECYGHFTLKEIRERTAL